MTNNKLREEIAKATGYEYEDGEWLLIFYNGLGKKMQYVNVDEEMDDLESLIELEKLESELSGLYAAQSQYDSFRAEFPFWVEDRIKELKSKIEKK